MVVAIEIHQLEENSINIEKSLININTQPKDAAASPAKPGKDKADSSAKNDKPAKDSKQSKPDKPDKPKDQLKDKKEAKPKAQPSDGQASPAKGKGKGPDDTVSKDNKGNDADRSKQPCMYFAYDSCSRGKECPYLHDPNNKYKGPKPKGLTPKGSGANASAGAATVTAATMLATQSVQQTVHL